ncbi:hypothetical protein AWH49_12785 [Domibacillus aminovorans]|uniref:Uncharacterized protein n=1 Tax=Domibacillus aminovorans TaxID=29332 RepID=A0A177L7M9_9BACI|nr:hypothetical protein AWH49_12785 [Domibacillus aminovorans]
MYKTSFQIDIYYQLMPTAFEKFPHSIRRKKAARENGGETEITVLIPNCENNNFVENVALKQSLIKNIPQILILRNIKRIHFEKD